MVKVIAVVSVCLVSQCVLAQSDVKSALALPAFHTMYQTPGGYRNTIAWQPAIEKGPLAGYLKIMGDKCFVDELLEAKDQGDAFVLNVDRMSFKFAQDSYFCQRRSVLRIPKTPAADGSISATYQSEGGGRPPGLSTFTFKP